MLPRKALLFVQANALLGWPRFVHAQAQPLYQRIRVTGNSDIDRLYPLLAGYAQDASLAETVTEVAVDTRAWKMPCYWDCELNKSVTETEPSSPIRDAGHLALESQVRSLKLGQDTTTAMIRSLEWKKREILGAWDGPSNKKEEHNQDFGLTAAALLLSLCPNIAKLYLGELPYESPLQDYMLKSNYEMTPVPALQKLTDVEILAEGGYGFLTDERMYGDVEFMQVFQYFHRLPSIQSIVMEGVEEYQADRHAFVPGTGNMTKIHIGHADVSGAMLERIITIPKNLEELHLSFGGLWGMEGGLPLVYVSSIGYALGQHKSSLRVLDLDIDLPLQFSQSNPSSPDQEADDGEEGGGWDEDTILQYGEDYFRKDREISVIPKSQKRPFVFREYGNTIGSLRGFTALTHLSISIKALLGPRDVDQPPQSSAFRLVDALPPSLEYFKLYGYARGANADDDARIDELMAEKASRFPGLKQVEGVEEEIPDLSSLYSEDTPEEELWERPERDISWKEAERQKSSDVPEKDEL